MQTSGGRAGGLVPSEPGRATLVVCLTLVTSATAHMAGGGALPGTPRMAMTMACACVLWWAGTWWMGSRIGLWAALVLGQAMGHLGWLLDTATVGTPDRMAALEGLPLDADPMPETMVAISAMSPMNGMHGAHSAIAMWCCHLVATLTSTALVLAIRLPVTAGSWLRRVLRHARTLMVVPLRRGVMRFPHQRIAGWMHSSPPPLRGPPAPA